MVYFGKDKKPLYKELAKYKGLAKSSIKGLKEGKTMMFPTGQTLIWLKRKPQSINDLAILNHEIFHCTCFILNRCGIQMSKKSDEAFAYLIQYLTEQIYNELDITFS